jgi:hypothetical protein
VVRIRVVCWSSKPCRRTTVRLIVGAHTATVQERETDDRGTVRFDPSPTHGAVWVAGAVRYLGRLTGDIEVRLGTREARPRARNPVAADSSCWLGRRPMRGVGRTGTAPSAVAPGRALAHPAWSEEALRAEAEREGLKLEDAHWQVLRFLRGHYRRFRLQVDPRETLCHLRQIWGSDLAARRPVSVAPSPITALCSCSGRAGRRQLH